MSKRPENLAARVEAGATALAAFAVTLTETEWQARIPKDGRKIDSGHAKENDAITKEATLALLASNGTAGRGNTRAKR
jgi:hypothetical protein